MQYIMSEYEKKVLEKDAENKGAREEKGRILNNLKLLLEGGFRDWYGEGEEVHLMRRLGKALEAKQDEELNER